MSDLRKTLAKHVKEGPLHPFLAAAWFTFVFHNFNKFELSAATVIAPLAGGILLAGTGFLIAMKAIKDPHKAALVSTFFVLAFFTFGYVQDFLLKNLKFAGWLCADLSSSTTGSTGLW